MSLKAGDAAGIVQTAPFLSGYGRFERASPLAVPGGERVAIRSRREEAALFLVVVLPLIALGLWAALGLDLYHEDALSRTYTAVQVVRGFEPKLANIGYAWAPLPTLAQVPIALLVPWLADRGGAGPVVSALATGVCVVLLNRILVSPVPDRRVRAVLLALFLANPLILTLAVNGLSEMPFLAFVLLGCLSLRRLAVESPVPIGAACWLGVAAAGAFLCRFEGVLVGGLFGLGLVVLLYRRVRAAAPRTTAVRVVEGVSLAFAAPFAYTVGLFVFFNGTITGNPLAFATGAGSNREFMAAFVPTQPFLQALVDDPLASARYILHASWNASPALFIAVPLALALAVRTRDLLLGALVAIAVSFPALQWYLHVSGQSAGWRRFYATNVLFTLLLLALGAHRLHAWRPGVARGVALAGVVLVLTFSNVASWVNLNDPGVRSDVTAGYLETAFGVSSRAAAEGESDQKRLLATYLRDELFAAEPTARVLIDDTQATGIILLTARPDRFVVPNVIDYAKIVADPVGRVEYVLVPELPTSQNRILERYPRLFEEGAPALELAKEFTGDWISAGVAYHSWRLYRVVPPAERADRPSGASA